MYEMDQLIDIIRREAAMVVAQMRQNEGTVVCTSYNPQNHTMRGMLVPHMIETSDIAIGTNAIGNGFGEATGPKVGDPQKLDGDQFNVNFSMGDGNIPIATHRIFSAADKPPVVQPGEWIRRHEKGQQIFFDQQGNATVSLDSGTKVTLMHDDTIVVMHGPSKSNITCDTHGNWTHDLQGKAFAIKNALSATVNDQPIQTGV